MTLFRPIAALSAGIFFILLATGAKSAEQPISLEYKPNARLKSSPASVPPARIFFGEFNDERPDPRQIGENLEDKAKRVIIATDDPKASAQFIKAALTNEFRKKGFRLVDQAGQADKIVCGSLLKFWTVETSRYNTETQVKMEVRDPVRGVTFSRLVSGSGKNFGRSLSAINYSESFSDALVMIMETLFQDQDFFRALGEKTVPTRPVVPEPSVVKEPPLAAPKTAIKSGEPVVERPLLSKKVDRPPSNAVDFIEHVVVPGETMATIVKWYAGDTTLWPVIAQHNPGLSPFKLKGGEAVRVPLSLATLHTEQPEYSTAAGPASRPVKKGPKGPPAALPAGAPPAPVIPVFGPK
jgi:hypothetical protein